MSQVSRDISNLPNSLHGDSQLDQSPLIAPGERQSETPSPPVYESSALLLDQDRTVNVPSKWNPTNEERERDHQKEETMHSSYAGGKGRHSKDKTGQSSANGQCTENDSLQSTANEQLTEGCSIHRSEEQWKERPQKDGTVQNSGAEGRPTEEEAQQLKSNGKEGCFSKTPENSVRMSSADPITCQPHAKSLLPRLMTGMPSDCAPLLQKGSVVISEPGRAKPGAGNGVMVPGIPTAVKSQKPQGKLQSHPSLNSQTSKSSKRSKGSSKSSISQVQSAAQEDCCAHCILACLFCEFLMLCNIALDCATCGSCSSDESCFCCCCSGECGDCDVPCDMDCGIVDACCESADCLEICMECCGLCFSS